MSNYDYPYPEVEVDTSGRHAVSVGHLVMGVAFLGLATIWLLFESDAIGSSDLRWFLPLPWLAAGLSGLLAVALTGRRSKPALPATPAYGDAEPVWTEPLWSEPETTSADDEDERR